MLTEKFDKFDKYVDKHSMRLYLQDLKQRQELGPANYHMARTATAGQNRKFQKINMHSLMEVGD